MTSVLLSITMAERHRSDRHHEVSAHLKCPYLTYMKSNIFTCVPTLKTVDLSVTLPQMGQVDRQVIMRQLLHVANE